MINKERFNEVFQGFEKEFMVELIDLACEQIPEIINNLSHDIDGHDFIHLKMDAVKIRGILSQLFDEVSSQQAHELEKATGKKIIEIVEISLSRFPEVLKNLHDDTNDHSLWWEIHISGSFRNYLTSLTGPLSDESILNLENLEKHTMPVGITQLFSELKDSTSLFLQELQVMKQELISGSI